MMFDIESVADRVNLTPAERAVLVEQTEALKVQADALIQHAKHGSAGDVMKTFLRINQRAGDMGDLCSLAVRRLVNGEGS